LESEENKHFIEIEQKGRKLTSFLFNFKKEQQNKKREGIIIERSSMALIGKA
jgi:hypothetical protein